MKRARKPKKESEMKMKLTGIELMVLYSGVLEICSFTIGT